jgi:isopenicillin-N N-acyltransferase-like protein
MMTSRSLDHILADRQPFYDWQGSPYEIGVLHGRSLREEIIAECKWSLDAAAAENGLSESQVLDAFLRKYEPVFRQYAPRAIDEIHGIADGGGFEYRYAFFAATRDGAKPLTVSAPDACTAFFCAPETTTDGHVLLGQTKDTAMPLSRYRVMRRTYADTGLATLTLNYPGWVSNLGINSNGVGCTGNSLYAEPAKAETAPFSLLRYMILESDSTARVRRVLDHLPPLENCCMMIADATGDAVCVEFVAGRRDVRELRGRAFGHANSVLSPALQALQSAKLGSPSSPQRQHNIQRLLDAARGSITAQTMRTILSDHTDHPHGICRHESEADPIVTTAAFIADLTARDMHLAIGNPCGDEFRTYCAQAVEPASPRTSQ